MTSLDQDSALLAGTVIDPDQPLTSDLPCVACEYNLRTIAAGACCPECGAPVARSLRGHYLKTCDPDWVNQLARAAIQLMGAFVGVLITGLVLFTSSMVMAMMSYDPSSEVLGVFILIAAGLMFLLTMMFYLVGVLRLTTAQPRRLTPEGPMNFRTLFRLTTLAACLLGLLGFGAIVLRFIFIDGLHYPRTYELLAVSGIVFLAVSTFFFIASYFMLPLRLIHLGKRLPAPSLVLQTRIICFGNMAVVVGWFVIYAAIILMAVRGGPGGIIIFSILGGLLSLLIFGLLIWMLVLLALYRNHLQTAAIEAIAWRNYLRGLDTNP